MQAEEMLNFLHRVIEVVKVYYEVNFDETDAVSPEISSLVRQGALRNESVKAAGEAAIRDAWEAGELKNAPNAEGEEDLVRLLPAELEECEQSTALASFLPTSPAWIRPWPVCASYSSRPSSRARRPSHESPPLFLCQPHSLTVIYLRRRSSI